MNARQAQQSEPASVPEVPAASRRITLATESFAGHPGLDTGISRALLQAAAEDAGNETFRLYVPGREVAFGKRDLVTPGYDDAVVAARSAGFEAIERLAGGRAAVFHPGTLAFAWSMPDPDPPSRIRLRFAEASEIIAAALGGLGIDARVGEVPGEYCPGDFSVSAAGVTKLAGIGQRLARRAAHVGGVIVVTDAAAVRDVLLPVYGAMGIDWDPATTGAVDGTLPGMSTTVVADAVITALADRHTVEPGPLPPAVVRAGEAMAGEHVARG